jgi:hypothetical protein
LTSARKLSGYFTTTTTDPYTFNPPYAPTMRPYDTRVVGRATPARTRPVASA